MHDQAVAVAEVSDTEQLLDGIVDAAVIRLDADGLIRGWHPGAQQLTGHPADDVLGRPLSVFHTPEDVANGLAARELRVAAETGRFAAEGWRVRKDGSRFWASATLTAIRDREGRAHGYVKVMRDLTGRRERDLTLGGIEQMVDSITDFEVIRLDRDGMVRSWNPGAERLTGYAAPEVVGHHVSMFYTEEDMRSGMADREMAATVRDGRMETEGWRLRKDGSRFWANVIMSPIRDDAGTVVGFVKVARDLTDRREQEQLVQRQRDEILELSTPVIQVWDKVLVLPLIGMLDSMRASRLTENLLERIAAEQAEVVILDVSGVPAIDSGVARHLLKTVEAARLMGAASVLSGVRPEIAQSMVHLGIDLLGLRSRTTLKDALQLALRLVGAAGFEPQRAASDV